MAEDAAAAKTGIFGGMSVCCFGCLLVFGFPVGIAGIVMVLYGWFFPGVFITGIIFLVAACLMAVVGSIALILTCVYGSKVGPVRPSPPRQQGPTVVVAPTVIVTGGSQQPVGYYGAQPVTQQQPMGYSSNYPPTHQQQPGGYYGTNPATQPAYMSTSGGPQDPVYPPVYQATEPPKPHHY